MADSMARQAVQTLRMEKASYEILPPTFPGGKPVVKGRRPRHTKSIARFFGVTLPDMHDAANCQQGRQCTGAGCRL